MSDGRWATLGLVAGAAVLGGLLLPWHRSGEATRNAFALARVVDDVGLVSSGLRRALFVLVFLLPLVVALALAAVVLDRPAVAGVAVAVSGGSGLAAMIVLLRTAGLSEFGPVVTGSAAVVALGSGARLVLGGTHVRQ